MKGNQLDRKCYILVLGSKISRLKSKSNILQLQIKLGPIL